MLSPVKPPAPSSFISLQQPCDEHPVMPLFIEHAHPEPSLQFSHLQSVHVQLVHSHFTFIEVFVLVSCNEKADNNANAAIYDIKIILVFILKYF